MGRARSSEHRSEGDRLDRGMRLQPDASRYIDALRASALLLAIVCPGAAASANSCVSEIRLAIAARNPESVNRSCWHIGPIFLGMNRQELLRTLNKPAYDAVNATVETLVYLYPRDLNQRLAAHPVRDTGLKYSQLVISLLNDEVVRVQAVADEDDATFPFAFAGIRMGAPLSEVVSRFGAFRGTNRSHDFFQYWPVPISFDTDDSGRIYGYTIARDMNIIGRLPNGSAPRISLHRNRKTGFIYGVDVGRP